MANLKQNQPATEVVNLPPRNEVEPKTRDAVAAKIGIGSGKQWDKLKGITEKAAQGNKTA